jgi:hypothetical protein
MNTILERAAAYLERMPPAIAGGGGHASAQTRWPICQTPERSGRLFHLQAMIPAFLPPDGRTLPEGGSRKHTLPPSAFRHTPGVCRTEESHSGRFRRKIRATFNAAIVFIRGFAIREQDALPLLMAWNQTHCQPPWTESDKPSIAATHGNEKHENYENSRFPFPPLGQETGNEATSRKRSGNKAETKAVSWKRTGNEGQSQPGRWKQDQLISFPPFPLATKTSRYRVRQSTQLDF